MYYHIIVIIYISTISYYSIQRIGVLEKMLFEFLEAPVH